MRVQLAKEFTFEAAHSLPHAPEGHKCRRLHGHSFRVEVVLAGEVEPDTGWFVDYGDILAVVKPIVDEHLDHRFLNEVPGLENPTSETLCRWLWERIRPRLPALVEIVVRETCTVACRYRGD
jgi:queuosine biosynthesis protein QueD